MIVSPGYMRSENIDFDEQNFEKLAQEGKTVVFVLGDNKLLGYIALSDIIRDTAKGAIKSLKSMDVESTMLTGDNQRVANHVGEILNIDKIIAEVLPEERALKVDELHREGKIVGMAGDG